MRPKSISPATLFKRFFKSAAFRTIICACAAYYIRFVYLTSRKSLIVDEGAKSYIEKALPAVYAFWHARLLMIPPIYTFESRIHVLISSHSDGEMIARIIGHFRLNTVRGSSSRGGATAAMNAIKMLQAGDSIAITPDGPRGPAMQAQEGVVAIARLAGVPVIPVSYSASRHKRLRSWDRFMVAYPFGRLRYKIAAPVMDVTRENVEAGLLQVTQEVDAA